MQIDELEVDKLNSFVFDLTQDILGCFRHKLTWVARQRGS